MQVESLAPITGNSDWSGADVGGRVDKWVFPLSLPETKEVIDAVKRASSLIADPTEITLQHFSLPMLSRRLEGVREALEAGYGFAIIRGIPIHLLSPLEAEIAFWGISSHFGRAISQNAYGDLIGHVRNSGAKFGAKDVRGYDTNAELRFHTDECDILALLCLRTAQSGGVSKVASAARIFNTLLEESPEHLQTLMRGYTFSLMGEHRPGVAPVTDHKIPIFSLHGNRLSCRYTRNTIEQASVYTGVSLSDQERGALDAFLEVANRPSIHAGFNLEPGDMQLLNNLAVLHSRTDYVDFDEEEKKRHLLRMWLTPHAPRELAQEFEERFNGGYSFRLGIPKTRSRAAS